MSHRFLRVWHFCAAWLLLCGMAAGKEPAAKPAADNADAKAASSKFMRLVRDEAGNLLSMDTAIVRYVSPKGVIVDLIGAVHVGERDYYKQLNKEFESYDALLYELVAPEGTRIPEGGGGRSAHPVGMVQQTMKSMLKLEFQLERINYQKDNFVHADMSPDEFAKSMKDRGESFTTMFLRMMGQGIAQQTKQQGGNDSEMLFAMIQSMLGDPSGALNLKRKMAEQMEDLDGAMSAFEGPNGSVIITERNKKALEVLTKEINAGKKSIGIFYGAGHMNDMEKRLLDEFGLKRETERWLTAWNLQEKSSKRSSNRKKAAAAAE